MRADVSGKRKTQAKASSRSGRTTAFGPLLTVDQVAKELQISRSWVYHLVNEGQLRATRVGERLRFRRDEILEYLERNRVAPEMREAGFPASEPLADENVSDNAT
jgi:excisionase family DNA binding protein